MPVLHRRLCNTRRWWRLLLLLHINDDDEDVDRPADDVSAMIDVALGGWGAVVGEEGSGDVG